MISILAPSMGVSNMEPAAIVAEASALALALQQHFDAPYSQASASKLQARLQGLTAAFDAGGDGDMECDVRRRPHSGVAH